MYILTLEQDSILTSEVNSMEGRNDNAATYYKNSQYFRMKHLEEYKEVGRHLQNIKDMFEEFETSKTNPTKTSLGTFTSFNDFLKNQGINSQKAYNYLKLFQNWHIVEALNMLEYEACYRLNRTLAVIKWANSKLSEDPDWLSKQEFKSGNRLVTKKVENGTVSVEQATPITKLEAYWIDKPEKDNDKPSYKELEKEKQQLETMLSEEENKNKALVTYYEEKIQGYKDEIERYKAELNHSYQFSSN